MPKKLSIFIKLIYALCLTGLISVAVLLILTLIPGFGSFKVLVVLSGSMEPTIKTGSIIIIKAAPDYKIDDIITFSQNPTDKRDISTTHRIVGIENNGFQTKGDANNAPDGSIITKNQVQGKVIIKIPYLGYGVEAARQPAGFAAIVIIPAAIIIAGEVKKIVVEVNKTKLKKDNQQELPK
ncbi:MAG TPA: signal peptidase I [Candidatus Jacksonbacteria bacterium]|nr:signal peptidase I [Candidatus Jacksonbacteria bacterium]HCC50590.1 signal peptidase I [Candidatus Jacksonbacteria bacterium]HCE49337.1 signal peptidase I [Candidatus Jacksonbacteria bacterium]HCR15273.1 signal peptidase I [Candidatus Jacksonbacteria bacterium]